MIKMKKWYWPYCQWPLLMCGDLSFFYIQYGCEHLAIDEDYCKKHSDQFKKLFEYEKL